ncbi:10767_t:CDS:2, partial [Cetraspora pellucida]
VLPRQKGITTMPTSRCLLTMSYDIASTEANTSQIALSKDNNLEEHEFSEPACDNEFEGPINNSVVITRENRELGLSKEIREGGMFQ